MEVVVSAENSDLEHSATVLKKLLEDMEKERNRWRDLVDSYKLAAESWRALYYSSQNKTEKEEHDTQQKS